MAKSSKSNKTSHVLNLLTNGGEGELLQEENRTETLPDGMASEPAQTGSGGQTAGSVSSAVKNDSLSTSLESGQVMVIDEASENDRLSGEIKKNLEENLAKSLEEKAEAEEAAASAKAKTAEEPSLPREEVRTPVPPAVSASAGESADQGAANAPEKTQNVQNTSEKLINQAKAAEEYVKDETLEADTEDEEFHIVNVMAAILKGKDIPDFMEQYGCCTCKKCVADVTALALTHLPAKYVVLEKDVTSPMIGFYQSRYRADILSSLLRACLSVKEDPRHDR